MSALSFSDAFTHSGHVHRFPVGAGLLAMAFAQSRTYCLTHRYRQQAGSYRGAGSHGQNCRSWLASDGRQR
ncbi:hypothetical protein EMIT0P44_950001 [Pseudomonas sp. IT-P44]